MADLCEAVGADVQQVSRGIGLDKRIGGKFLHAGPGYGGSCFPQDTPGPGAHRRRRRRAPTRLVETTVEVNDARKLKMAEKIADALGGELTGKTVALLGRSPFKPNTDDMRDAASLAIVPALQARGAHVRAFDPEGMHEAARLLSDVAFATNAYEAAQGADAVVIVTEWDQFRALDLKRLKSVLKNPIMVDLRNVYQPADLRANGFEYSSLGRSS